MTYWNEKGKHQAEYDELVKQVPGSGKAEAEHIELLRCIGNVYYDCYNNGGCNLNIRRDELDTIKSMSDRIIDKMGDDDWPAFSRIMKTLTNHADDLDEPTDAECPTCYGSGVVDYGDEDDPITCSDCHGEGYFEGAGAFYLPKNWPESDLEKVTDAIILLVAECEKALAKN
jgi:hypothetical protein